MSQTGDGCKIKSISLLEMHHKKAHSSKYTKLLHSLAKSFEVYVIQTILSMGMLNILVVLSAVMHANSESLFEFGNNSVCILLLLDSARQIWETKRLQSASEFM